MVPALLLTTALAVPFVPQAKDTCGAAALTMVLRYWGHEVSHDDVAAKALEAGATGFSGQRLADIARERGFFALVYEGDLDHLRDFTARGRPLIVALSAGHGRYHDVVVTGFDPERDEILLHDPAQGRDRRLKRARFEQRWREAGGFTLLVLPARP